MMAKRKIEGGMEIHLTDGHVTEAVRQYVQRMMPTVGIRTVELGAEKTGVFGSTAGVKAVVGLK